MKPFEVKGNVGDAGEYILGSQQTGSHACYLIYGVMMAGEQGREIKPGEGHEELILAVKGDFNVYGHYTGLLQQGKALHLKGEETCWLENDNNSEAVYIISGGHSEKGHH